MHRNRSNKAKGFTLVEILIVVVILGILAAIVIPQFSSASESAKKSNLETQLRQLRSQITLYSNEHNGSYPDIITNWDDLTAGTDITGAAGTDYGPYLMEAPVNPFTNSSTAVAAGSAAATNGWTYNATDGTVLASMPSAKATELNLTSSDVETY